MALQANIWASDNTADSKRKAMPQVNGRLEDKDDTNTNIDMCLEQLARAISAHVTDILIERLGLEERNAQKQEASTSMELSTVSTVGEPPFTERPQHLTLKAASSRPIPRIARSLPQSPTPGRRSQIPRRRNDSGQRYAEPLERRGARHTENKMMRYHSENRLNRIEPPPGTNETPLENRASRLRRASTGKKLAAFRGD
ncbi:hypothetical protein OESDEN_03586 [Oesophagostomum dentatum]|uniref:Uncharacterized protein n=1 Tax=Oesophagostomum dentatum TaxID=61180 RepID=A0A0B1TK13_OESDE|nr:hypothetical protein OESDEN_03586 [Oesophagostomum dentatum]